MSKKKKRTIILLSSSILAILVIIGCVVLAYLTHKDEVINILTVGDVKIALHESEYPGNGDSDVNNMLPNIEVKKNPNVENTGMTSAYVFLKVSVPVEKITEVAFDGTKGEKKAQEVFYLKTNTTPQETLENSFYNDNWIELTDKESGTDYQDTVRTYIFGYKKALEHSEQTDVLFDKVQLKNIIENEILRDSKLHIDVQAIGIQADYLEKDYPKENLSTEELSEIYDYIK